MVSPTSDLQENVDPDDAPRCSVCEEPIVGSSEHRVVTWIDDDRVQSDHYCSDGCFERR